MHQLVQSLSHFFDSSSSSLLWLLWFSSLCSPPHSSTMLEGREVLLWGIGEGGFSLFRADLFCIFFFLIDFEMKRLKFEFNLFPAPCSHVFVKRFSGFLQGARQAREKGERPATFPIRQTAHSQPRFFYTIKGSAESPEPGSSEFG